MSGPLIPLDPIKHPPVVIKSSDQCPKCGTTDIIHIGQSYDIVCNSCHYRGREWSPPPKPRLKPKPVHICVPMSGSFTCSKCHYNTQPDLRIVYQIDTSPEPKFESEHIEPSLKFKTIANIRRWTLS